MQKKYKIGVIGCGRIASAYLAAFPAMQDILQPCFAVDKVLDRAKDFAAHFEGCGYSDNIEDLLLQPLDAVHILTPHYLHCEHALRCLHAGFHVLTEKPISTTLADADRMIQAAEETGKQLGVIFQSRYMPGVVALKKLIEDGALGEIKGVWSTLNWCRPPSYYACDWKGSWEKEGGGVVIDQAIHSIDLVRFLLGSEVKNIEGFIDRRVLTSIEVEDVADAAIRFANGVVYAFYASNYCAHNSPIHIEFTGSKGSALIVESRVTIQLDGQAPYDIESASPGAHQGPRYWGYYHEAQIRAFYEALSLGKQVPIAPKDAKKTLAIVLGIYESSLRHNDIFPRHRAENALPNNLE